MIVAQLSFTEKKEELKICHEDDHDKVSDRSNSSGSESYHSIENIQVQHEHPFEVAPIAEDIIMHGEIDRYDLGNNQAAQDHD